MKRYLFFVSIVIITIFLTSCGKNRIDLQEDSKTETEKGLDLLDDGDMEFSGTSTVKDVISNPSFEGFGRLLFPVDLEISESMTLNDISSSSTYLWYSNIKPEKTVEIVNYLNKQSENNKQVFYSIYSQEEISKEPSKANTGLFFFRGEPENEFAIVNAGGGFMYVGAMHDSFPQALEISKNGYNAFALIYRPDYAYEDLAAAINYINDHAKELQVNNKNYSLWGGSAGARMAAILGNRDYLYQLLKQSDIEQASAVVMQYTGYTSVLASDAPTYTCVGTSDGIANWRTMENRLNALSKLGIPTEFHSYDGLSHGFGLGTGTVADGWIEDAISFWENQMK